MKKKIIAVIIASLEAAVASLLAFLQLYEALKENSKFKGNTEIYLIPFNSKLESQYFLFQNLKRDLTSQISLHL